MKCVFENNVAWDAIMRFHKIIQEAVWVTALSCWAQRSISLPSATDPSLRSGWQWRGRFHHPYYFL